MTAKPRPFPRSVALLFVPLALAACIDVRAVPSETGGSVSVPRAAPASVPVASQPAAAGRVEGASIYELRRAPAQVVQTAPAEAAAALNGWRRAQGLAPLTRSAQLQRAAQAHSDDMARMNKMGHVGSDGSRVGARTRAAGYDFREVAENVAMTPLGIDSAMELWAKSPSHRAAMSRGDLREFGLAQNGRYWTLVMGLRK
ncbi:CAP domain-containing protein [Salipiger mangrovisoli]|uniref:CAP domain-containing protein n=1 Tax=Salipiger mangrovisoli TaxID=2865933 RepID=A0ABR9X8C3_9RHOB|nr:CAP domain-containing protein [Salipiger mangrovisoli]MBE9639736.1 CAP domain-containing protein [Salipiger mangrovisoli]